MEMYLIRWEIRDSHSKEVLQAFDAAGRLFPTEKSALRQAAQSSLTLNRDADLDYHFRVIPVNPPIREESER